ncbi:MAG: threonine synthase [Candidatus Dormibacteraeota bacterium]|nr:threonine synthase [Candidatus Dormibacteraeota bacterium]
MPIRRGVIERYADRLPVTDSTPRITLFEGETPCIPAPRIARELGLSALHLKFEGLNPTGSFKDRGMVVAVARALEAGSSILVCASTGNTSASAAAYGARFGLRTVVVVPAGRIAGSKLVQAQVAGAEVLAIDGNFDRALAMVRELATDAALTLVNSVNPHRIEGQKTAAFEIVDELGDAPDVVAIPVGNAGNITAYWRGFREYHRDGLCCQLPRMLGGQAAGAAPLVLGHVVEHPETVATAIRIGNPASWSGAIEARDQSEGMIDSVEDEEILSAQRDLAAVEGVFCEPASAASLAVLRKAVAGGFVAPGTSVVCVLTGSGLKDPLTPAAALRPPTPVGSDLASLAAAIGLS